nr:KUP/HAK/KT family potassium transporter [uncultured Undibacterium sp.]
MLLTNIPSPNWILLVGVLLTVLGFGSSSAMAGAYGIAVTMLITSFLPYSRFDRALHNFRCLIGDVMFIQNRKWWLVPSRFRRTYFHHNGNLASWSRIID